MRGVEGARSSLIDFEELSDEELARLAREFHQLQQRGETDKPRVDAMRKELEQRKDSGSPERP